MNELREYIYSKKPNDIVNLQIARGKINKTISVVLRQKIRKYKCTCLIYIKIKKLSTSKKRKTTHKRMNPTLHKVHSLKCVPGMVLILLAKIKSKVVYTILFYNLDFFLVSLSEVKFLKTYQNISPPKNNFFIY